MKRPASTKYAHKAEQSTITCIILVPVYTLSRTDCAFKISDPSALLSENNDKAANSSYQLSLLKEKFAPVAEQSDRLKAILFSMIGWIVAMTIALLIVVSIAFRHWRRHRSPDLHDSSTIRSVSVADNANMADFEPSEQVAKKPKRVPGNPPAETGPPLPAPLYSNAPALVYSTPRHARSPLATVTSGDETGASSLRSPPMGLA